jgi:hypothetical protein
VWWSQVFIETSFWRAAAGTLLPPIECAQLPAALLERFPGMAAERLLEMLRYLVPISSESAVWAGFLKGRADPHKMRLALGRSDPLRCAHPNVVDRSGA